MKFFQIGEVCKTRAVGEHDLEYSIGGFTLMTIKEARKAARMTQQQLADQSGVNIRQIQRVESGASQAGNLTAKNLIAIADALGIDPHELI